MTQQETNQLLKDLASGNPARRDTAESALLSGRVPVESLNKRLRVLRIWSQLLRIAPIVFLGGLALQYIENLRSWDRGMVYGAVLGTGFVTILAMLAIWRSTLLPRFRAVLLGLVLSPDPLAFEALVGYLEPVNSNTESALGIEMLAQKLDHLRESRCISIPPKVEDRLTTYAISMYGTRWIFSHQETLAVAICLALLAAGSKNLGQLRAALSGPVKAEHQRRMKEALGLQP